MSNRSDLEMFMKECASLEFEKNVSLADHSTMKVGGAAEYVAYPASESALCALTDYLTEENIKYMVVGNGSNLIFPDCGFDGVILLTTRLKKIRKTRNTLYAESGVSLSALALYAQKNGLSGLEFAYGIPGTVGGAVYMNAGAYDGEIKDVLQKSSYFDPKASKRFELYNRGHEFEYRKSVYMNSDLVILSAVFELTSADPKVIKEKMDGFMAARKEKQPLDYPSAGSTFKRCGTNYTAKMIDECGLKGYTVGGAQVSEKHAGFIINRGNATSKDIKTLVGIIKEKIKDKFDVDIQEEIKFID